MSIFLGFLGNSPLAFYFRNPSAVSVLDCCMKVSWKWVWSGVLGLLCTTALAIPPNSADEYQKIPERNVFGLTEPPEQVQQTAVEPPAALPKVFLTGITTIFGNKMALFSVQFPAKAGQPAREQSLTLAEGQGDEGIEVLSVDENAKVVRV